MAESIVISFSPELPCASIAGPDGRLCGQPATVASLYRTGGGQYLMLPQCRACVMALRTVYLANERPEEEK